MMFLMEFINSTGVEQLKKEKFLFVKDGVFLISIKIKMLSENTTTNSVMNISRTVLLIYMKNWDQLLESELTNTVKIENVN